MTRRIAFSAAAGLTLTFVLAACSGSAATTAPSAAANAPSAAPATEAPSEAPSVAPSEAPSAAPSEAPSAAPSEEPSIAIPSFVLPSDDKGLEALLPAQLCGKAATKLSASGTRYEKYQTASDKALLSQLGKTAADVVFAFATPGASNASCHTTAFAYRVKGADPDQLKALFIALSKQETKTTYTTGNVGGRDVYIGVTPDVQGKSYVYFKGDGLFGVSARDEANAAQVLAGMP